MKTPPVKLIFLVSLIAAVYFSCTPKGQKDLILGNWQLSHSPTKEVDDSVNTQLIFTSSGTAKFQSYVNGNLTESDSATYHFSNDGQYLVTDKNGAQLDSVKITELTTSTLKLNSPGKSDTATVVFVKK